MDVTRRDAVLGTVLTAAMAAAETGAHAQQAVDLAPEYDFISIGGGIGGLAAAIAAHDAGLKVLILEKSEKIGGVASLSLGQLWVPGNHLAKEAGITDTVEAGIAYIDYIGGGYAQLDLTRAIYNAAPAVAKYYQDKAGVKWTLFRHYPDYFYPMGKSSTAEGRYLEVAPFAGPSLGGWAQRTRGNPTGRTNAESHDVFVPVQTPERLARDERTMGAGLGAYFAKAVLDRRITVLTGVTTTDLVQDKGRVTGLRAQYQGRALALRARRGILIAASGYDWSKKFTERYDARPAYGTRTMPAVTGDHLRWAGMLGAQVASPHVRPQWVAINFREPGDFDAEGIPRWQGISTRFPHVIMVNRYGKRFSDESWGPSYIASLAHVDPREPRLENQPFWAVFDSQHREKYAVGRYGPKDALPSVIVQADTLKALAAKVGIDPKGLADQVKRFNSYVKSGTDLEFQRGTRPQGLANGDLKSANPVMGTVEKGPFYAVPMEVASIGIPSAGLVADTSARVLDWNDRPIEGLYVTGNSMAMLDMGVGYQSGTGNTRGMTFGYIAARHAAGKPLFDA